MNNDWTVSGQGIPSNIFIKAPDDDLNCIICYEVLYDPVQVNYADIEAKLNYFMKSALYRCYCMLYTWYTCVV